MYWRFWWYCSVHLKTSGIACILKEYQLESNLHVLAAYLRCYNFAWCFPRCLSFWSCSIYFCYLLHCQHAENRLSSLSSACNVPAAAWLSLLGFQGAVIIITRMESLNKQLFWVMNACEKVSWNFSYNKVLFFFYINDSKIAELCLELFSASFP